MNFGNAINNYRASRWCYTHKLKIFAKLIRGLGYFFHNSYIPYTADIGKGTLFAYKGIGVVVHSRAVIGENCVIGANVTIGGRHSSKSTGKDEGVPVIGNNVYISTGAKVLGSITVGDNVIIGANAVLISDAPANTVWAGVPAHCIRQRDPEDTEMPAE